MSEFPRRKNKFEQEPESQILIEAQTVASDLHPDHNEDSYEVSRLADGTRVIGVFDGMGGVAGGAEASAIATRTAVDFIRNYTFANVQEMKAGVNEALRQAHLKIQEHDRGRKMGTTGILTLVKENGAEFDVVIGSVGDSRVYRARSAGELEAVTLDDSTYRKKYDLVDARQVQKFLGSVQQVKDLPILLRDYFFTRNVASAMLGASTEINPNLYELKASAGEMFLIMTDGVHDNLTDSEINTLIVQNEGNPDGLSKALVAAAQARSRESAERSKPDDMTVVVFELGKDAATLPKNDLSELDFANPKPRAFLKGELVQVPRSSGILESGWTVGGYDDETGDVIVRLGNLRKNIPAAELTMINPEPDYSCLGRAQSFEELTYLVNRLGVVPGYSKQYSARELNNIIERVRIGQAPVDLITTNFGLRQRVTDLLSINSIHQTIRRKLSQ